MSHTSPTSSIWRYAHLFREAWHLFTDDSGAGGWVREFVDLGCVWRGPHHPALHRLVYGAWRWGPQRVGHLVSLLGAGETFLQGYQERGAGTICRGLREDLEAVGRGQALPPMEQTPPPALALRDMLFQNSQNVSFAESQLIKAVRGIVIKCPGQERLGVGREKEFIVITTAIDPCTNTAQSGMLELVY